MWFDQNLGSRLVHFGNCRGKVLNVKNKTKKGNIIWVTRQISRRFRRSRFVLRKISLRAKIRSGRKFAQSEKAKSRFASLRKFPWRFASLSLQKISRFSLSLQIFKSCGYRSPKLLTKLALNCSTGRNRRFDIQTKP